ncbi:hypothetical protein Clacol_010354 [Clathrus columnatus]|uniref:HNH nuclease domain-containing protein n=1 Tax=Clathrus columnatus TaxID=1419009 RepID=A0AAV5AW04_9AGAM|nr:hypothetical protein Clacol_010354 [Clathrus columnatus]
MTDTHRRSSSFSDISDLFSGSLTPVSTLLNGSQLTKAANTAKGSKPTQDLVDKAERILASFEQDQNRLVYHQSNLPRSKTYNWVDPHVLLKVMLENAPNEHGQRYVASAIGECDGDTSALVDLSNTWLRYLLVPFKGNRSLASFPASEAATPTYNMETAYGLDPHPSNREPSMTQLVRMREGYQCPFTEYYHKGCAPPDAKALSLEVAHIVKRAIGVFDTTKHDRSLVTWDIIRNYVGWNAQRTQEVLEKLDTPSMACYCNTIFNMNGIVLRGPLNQWSVSPLYMPLHPDFPQLKANGELVPDTYEVEEMGHNQLPPIPKGDAKPANRQITFRDRGTDPTVQKYIPQSDKKLITKPRPLPDPELISLHRAICRVLHLSGATEVIDSIFRDFGENGQQVPSAKIRTTDELDLMISTLAFSALSA